MFERKETENRKPLSQNLSENHELKRHQTRESAKFNAGWMIALGSLMVILGGIAIASPLFASIAVGIFLGWLFIASSIIQGVEAIQHYRSGSTLVLRFLIGLLYLGLGILLLFDPWASVISLTLLIGIFFFVDGIFRVFLAFQLKPRSRWGWILFNGIFIRANASL